MKPRAIYLYILLMLNSIPLIAQPVKSLSIHWDTIASLPPFDNQRSSIGVAGPVVGVINEQLIVAGGANFPDKLPWLGGKKIYNNNISIFSKQKNEIHPHIISSKLPYNIAYAANCVTPLGIAYAGGENELGLSQKVYLLTFDNVPTKIKYKSLPDLPQSITNASLIFNDNILYLLGGENETNTSQQFLCLNFNDISKGWIRLPQLPKPLSNMVAVIQLVNGKKQIFVIGGRTKQQNNITVFSSEVYSFDVKINKWYSRQSLPYAIAAGTGYTFSEKYIILFGGDKGEQFNNVETTILSSKIEVDQDKKQNLINYKNKLLETHPGFSQEILLYNTATNRWTKNGVIPFNTSVTTNAVQWGDEIVIPSGEIKAGIRTPRIISAKISFHE